MSRVGGVAPEVPRCWRTLGPSVGQGPDPPLGGSRESGQGEAVFILKSATLVLGPWSADSGLVHRALTDSEH